MHVLTEREKGAVCLCGRGEDHKDYLVETINHKIIILINLRPSCFLHNFRRKDILSMIYLLLTPCLMMESIKKTF